MRRDLRAPRGAVGWNVKIDRLAIPVPTCDDSHAIAKLNQAFRPTASVIFDIDAATGKRMAMRKGKTHQPTCSTASDPAGSDRISDCAGTVGSSQSTHAARSRMTICLSW